MGNKKAFTMWEESVFFQDGYYLYMDGNNHVSVISKERAMNHEAEYYGYQASMDVGRGGVDPELAYPGRGFVKDESGHWKYGRACYVATLSEGETEAPIQGAFRLPERVGAKTINFIERKAFLNCDRMMQITMPLSIKRIGAEAFKGCVNLEKIHLSENIIQIEQKAFQDTAFYQKKENWENGVLYLGNWLIRAESELSGNCVVREGTVGIADEAFRDCAQLEGVQMPDSVRYIGHALFSGCSRLKSVKFPARVQQFGSRVLSNCESLESVELPAGIDSLKGIFYNNAKLTSIKIPDGIKEIGQDTFKNCTKLVQIQLPDSLCSIGRDAFDGTGYFQDKSNWTEGVLYLGNWLLKADKDVAGSIRVKEGTVGIADRAFGAFMGASCPLLTEVLLPDSIKYIGNEAFQGCTNLQTFRIPPLVQHLKCQMLRSCSALTEIIVPKSVTQIDQWVFYHCRNLEKLVIENDAVEIQWPAVVGCEKLIIYAKEGSTAQAYAWKDKIAFQVITEGK